MATRDRDDESPAVPTRTVDGRPSRIAQARGYHPRARTAGDAGRNDDTEPKSRTATARAERSRDRSRGERSRTDWSKTDRVDWSKDSPAKDSSAQDGDPDRPSLRLVADDERRTRTTRDRERTTREGTTPEGGRTTRQGTTREGGRTTREGTTRERTSTRTGQGARQRTRVSTTGRTVRTATPTRRRVSDRFGSRDAAPPIPPKLADPGRRLRATLSVILVLFLVIAVRLVQFQFTDGAAYAEQGLSDRIQPVDLPAPRGNIIDRDGAILAGSAEARYVFADPDLVKDPARTAETLSPILGVPRSKLLPKLAPHLFDNGTAVRFEYLARGVSVDTGTLISALNLTGIGVRRDESRVVPGHDLAANLIGFTGDDMNGLEGLEASYDDVLRGVDGTRRFEIGTTEGDLDQEIPGGFHDETPARPGSTLQLTIDRDLQYEVQRILATRMAANKATVAAAVVEDVRTGEVLAQASYPTYNAADPDSSDPATWVDNATGLVVEPGSVHKGIVFAASLQEGVVKPSDTIMVGPSVRKGGVTYTDTHPNATPRPMTLPGILAFSSNVGTIGLADKLGAQNLYNYQKAFGLGTKTDEGLPGESAGLIQPPQNWSGSSYGSIPIGHGVSVTPLQMAAVYAAIANGGVYIQPHLIKAVIAPDGTSTPATSSPTRQVISADNAAALRTMLEAVVTVKDATGVTAAVPHYRVSGKTGTGTLIRNGKAVDGDVASFIGMAPADAPRYVIAVFAHIPPGGGGNSGNGGPVAGPAFSDMMSATLAHFRVQPSVSTAPPFKIYG